MNARTDHQWRQLRVRDRETVRINALVQWGYSIEWLTRYHARINGLLDLYPTGMRWHHIGKKRRGYYGTGDDLPTICKSLIGGQP